jgi:hypothetical protein
MRFLGCIRKIATGLNQAPLSAAHLGLTSECTHRWRDKIQLQYSKGQVDATRANWQNLTAKFTRQLHYGW